MPVSGNAAEGSARPPPRAAGFSAAPTAAAAIASAVRVLMRHLLPRDNQGSETGGTSVAEIACRCGLWARNDVPAQPLEGGPARPLIATFHDW
jgi:hypothetical protein